jgi:hypothetical protein
VDIIREESPEEDDMFSTFSQMVIDSKGKLEKNTPVGQLNRIPESRKDVIFDYLRTIEKDFSLLEKQVGKFIPLPIFADKGPCVPKDFDPNENFFLSEQRFSILKDIITKAPEGFLLDHTALGSLLSLILLLVMLGSIIFL